MFGIARRMFNQVNIAGEIDADDKDIENGGGAWFVDRVGIEALGNRRRAGRNARSVKPNSLLTAPGSAGISIGLQVLQWSWPRPFKFVAAPDAHGLRSRWRLGRLGRPALDFGSFGFLLLRVGQHLRGLGRRQGGVGPDFAGRCNVLLGCRATARLPARPPPQSSGRAAGSGRQLPFPPFLIIRFYQAHLDALLARVALQIVHALAILIHHGGNDGGVGQVHVLRHHRHFGGLE
jgi:hypothetical protein